MAHQGCGQAWGKLVKVSASPGSEILLINRECTVGRKKDCDLSFPANKLVSGNHCRITQDQNSGQVWLEDMSTNGTVINMSKVVKKQTHLLQNGDVIHFVYRKNEPEQNIAYVYQAIGPQESASQDTEVSESYGAFTPDSNEALSASDLHFKSMQRRDRHPAARFAQMKPRSHRQRHTATERHNPIHFQRRAGDFLSFLDPFGGDEENQAAGYEQPEDQGETEAAAAGHSETGELTGSFDISEPGSPLPEPAAASASSAGPSASAAVPTVPPRRRAQRRPGEQPSEVERQLLEALQTRPEAPAPPPRSEDELFLLSLVPSLQSLPPQTKEFVKFQIHKLIYESSTVPLNLEQLEPKEQF